MRKRIRENEKPIDIAGHRSIMLCSGKKTPQKATEKRATAPLDGNEKEKY